MSHFETPMTIRFEHCDAFGIVFYPNYVRFVNLTVELWFEEELDLPFDKMHHDRRIGIPVRHLECEYILPSRLNDILTFKLCVVKLGNSSATLSIHTYCGDELRFTAQLVIVFSISDDNDQVTKIPIPDDLREKMQGFVCDES